MNEENENQPVPLNLACRSNVIIAHAVASRESVTETGAIGSGAMTQKSRPILHQLMPILAAPLLTSRPSTDRPQAGARGGRLLPKVANKFRPNRNLVKVSLKSLARVSGSYGMRSATSCKRRRIFL